MCGRISTGDLINRELADLFHLAFVPNYLHSYNVAPSQSIPVIRIREKIHYLDSLVWGLIPHWVKDKETGVSAFNARIETLGQKPFFRDSFKSRRCIVPASGFYEWQKRGDKKYPYYFYRADHKPIALAGLWDVWVDEVTGDAIKSCTLVTLPANGRMLEIHERMPAILEEDLFDTWLDPGYRQTDVLEDIIRSPKPELLKMYPVSGYVSNSRHDGEQCLQGLSTRMHQ